MADELRMGLRFRKGQAKVLTAIADRLKGEGIATEHVTLFEQAAAAANIGEPLLVLCGHPSEVELMADGFVRFGLARPAIEDLNVRTG